MVRRLLTRTYVQVGLLAMAIVGIIGLSYVSLNRFEHHVDESYEAVNQAVPETLPQRLTASKPLAKATPTKKQNKHPSPTAKPKSTSILGVKQRKFKKPHAKKQTQHNHESELASPKTKSSASLFCAFGIYF